MWKNFVKTALARQEAPMAAPDLGAAFEKCCQVEASDLPFHYI
jgi:hypothetical protein